MIFYFFGFSYLRIRILKEFGNYKMSDSLDREREMCTDPDPQHTDYKFVTNRIIVYLGL